MNYAVAEDEIELRLVGHSDPGGSSIDVVVDGDYAYVADGTKGVAFINVSDPYNPKRTSSTYYNTDGHAQDVSVNGDIIYVADSGNGLVILDVSNKSDPKKIGHYDNDFKVYDLVVIDMYAYLANEKNGLLILDISDPENIQWVGQNDTSGYGYGALGVTVVDNLAYVTDRHEGLFIIDVSDPEDPVRIGHNSTTGVPAEVFIADDLAYIADDENGLVILDVSDPYNPVWVSRYNTPGRVDGVEKVGNYVYAADNHRGLMIINVSDPYHPKKAASYDTSYWHWGLTVAGNYVYLADEGNGLVIYELVPIGHIMSISSNRTFYGQPILFSGYGTDNEPVFVCEWNSSIDGVFSTDLSFNITTLSTGSHNISFRVQDSNGVWSHWVNWSEQLNISANDIPTASIESISPNPARVGERIYFNGSGTDDGTIVTYLWSSSKDGEMYNGKDQNFSDTNLSQGNHTITLKVQDNHGVWSAEISVPLVILENEGDTGDLNETTEDTGGDDLFLFESLGPFPIFVYMIFMLIVFGVLITVRRKKVKEGRSTVSGPQPASQQPIPQQHHDQNQQQYQPNTQGQNPLVQQERQQPQIQQHNQQFSPQKLDHQQPPVPQNSQYPPPQTQPFSSQTQDIQHSSLPTSFVQNQSENWNCPQCGKTNDSQYRFCMNCGFNKR